MNNSKDKNTVLRLDASYKIKHEKYESFNESIFKNIYNQASKNVEKIIETTDTDFAYKETVSNLIAFDGKRGSGKTSAMLSFCDFLRRFNDYDIKKSKGVCNKLLELNDSVSFTVLDCTDATLLADSKELIGAVLGKMLTAIKEREETNSQLNQRADVRKLRTRLGEIYCSMLPQDTNRDEASPWEVLEQLSRSWNQQRAFRESVQQFNEYMSEGAGLKKQNYLVIPIDDVDMNIQNGYALLEAIRKYMMVPNAIVLLAADDYQLEIICRQAFNKGFDKRNDSVLAQKLALEYLEKLIPSGRRIYMPDLFREENLYGHKINILQDEEDGGEEKTIQNTIIRNVWKYVGIILNSEDKNSHWLQPHSLRKLSNYINAMRFLPEILESDKEQGEFYGNIDWFYEDIIKRYLPDAERQHSEEKRQKYEEIEETIKKFEDAVLAKKLEKLAKGLQDCMHNPMLSEKVDVNSYGTLLVLLYEIREGDFSEICQATSFILSLQMRRLIYPIENDKDKYDQCGDMIEFSKGDFWGNLDKIWLDTAGKSQEKYEIYCEFPIDKLLEMLEDGVLTAGQLFLLAMQLDISDGGKTEEGKYLCKGSFRFGNFINCIFAYEKKIDEIVELIQGNGKEIPKIKEAQESLKNEFKKWKEKYGTTRVIPFDSVEFMFSVFDALYGNQGVFSAFETGKEYAGMYRDAVGKIGDILDSYDGLYKDIRSKYPDGKCDNVLMRELTREYKKVYEECPFIKIMKKNNDIIVKYISLFEKQENSGGGQTEDGNTIAGTVNSGTGKGTEIEG